MGTQIITQPDGLLAVWSSGVGAIVIIDATDEELIEHRVAQAAERARRDTREAIALAREHGTSAPRPFDMTWDEALAEHAEIHGASDPALGKWATPSDDPTGAPA